MNPMVKQRVARIVKSPIKSLASADSVSVIAIADLSDQIEALLERGRKLRDLKTSIGKLGPSRTLSQTKASIRDESPFAGRVFSAGVSNSDSGATLNASDPVLMDEPRSARVPFVAPKRALSRRPVNTGEVKTIKTVVDSKIIPVTPKLRTVKPVAGTLKKQMRLKEKPDIKSDTVIPLKSVMDKSVGSDKEFRRKVKKDATVETINQEIVFRKPLTIVLDSTFIMASPEAPMVVYTPEIELESSPCSFLSSSSSLVERHERNMKELCEITDRLNGQKKVVPKVIPNFVSDEVSFVAESMHPPLPPFGSAYRNVLSEHCTTLGDTSERHSRHQLDTRLGDASERHSRHQLDTRLEDASERHPHHQLDTRLGDASERHPHHPLDTRLEDASERHSRHQLDTRLEDTSERYSHRFTEPYSDTSPIDKVVDNTQFVARDFSMLFARPKDLRRKKGTKLRRVRGSINPHVHENVLSDSPVCSKSESARILHSKIVRPSSQYCEPCVARPHYSDKPSPCMPGLTRPSAYPTGPPIHDHLANISLLSQRRQESISRARRVLADLRKAHN